MSLTLNVDGPRWRAHLQARVAANPGLVPVIKGNGYGFGKGRLAAEAAALGVDTIAVGTYDEIADVAGFPGDVVVLTPWRPFGSAIENAPSDRVIHTVSRPADLEDLLVRQPTARFVVERATSMLRHGMTARELREAAGQLDNLHQAVGLEGVSFHLPLAGSNLSQAQRLMTDTIASGLPTRSIWVSHLTRSDLEALRTSYADFTIRPRIGTDLWLGERSALRVTATVLDLHHVERGDTFGYRGRTAPKAGTILVVSGGTSHGIGLEAPSGDLSMKARAATLARGGLDAVGFVRSPYSVFGKQRLFAEPPHMQASMLFLPQGALVPAVGDEIEVRVRYTATDFDKVLVSS
ncbi:Alanine racemase domain protein [metagenome]|uniref:Alanine racemase domain protein n=1 Tax=metagenome TaxID=256318 RepID=A0A2P2BZ78_9ZZZZ